MDDRITDKPYVFSDLVRMTNDFWTCQFRVRSTIEHTLYIKGLMMDFLLNIQSKSDCSAFSKKY